MEPISSNRSIKGGIFNVAKSQYSPETRKIVNDLIQESRLTLQLRQRVHEALDRGEPLPVADARARPLPPTARRAQAPGHAQTYAALHLLPPRAARRPRHVIERSGAYERDTFLPRIPRVDRAKELARLQNIMTYGRSEPPMEKIVKTTKKKEEEIIDLPDDADMLDNLMEEIDERLKFLDEMKQLGEEKKYQQIIMSEITGKLRQIEKIDKAQNLSSENTTTTSPE
ncbi:UPF0193 protein EVG1 homolog [Gryllus bimaculatus]|nr:UPF0193 protein EVG1 homolog [Gryllus bimaculatus]